MWLLALMPFLLGTKAQLVSQYGDKCSMDYTCPPEFLRIDNNCYFFSKNISSWNEALAACQNLHGKLAIPGNSFHDNVLRSFLSKTSIVFVERWIGGKYDSEKSTWKFPQASREFRYRGFPRVTPDEEGEKLLQEHCIVLDPELEYKWNSRSCLEQKHFICQTKIKQASPHSRDKLKKHHKKSNLSTKPSEYNEYLANLINETDNEIIKETSYAFTNSTMKVEKSESKKKGSKKDRFNRSPKNKLYTNIYNAGTPISELNPKIITEEFSLQ